MESLEKLKLDYRHILECEICLLMQALKKVTREKTLRVTMNQVLVVCHNESAQTSFHLGLRDYLFLFNFLKLGFDYINYNIRNGRRVSTNTAFLDPLRNSPRLTIHKFSEVTRVLLRGEDNEAYGVEYHR